MDSLKGQVFIITNPQEKDNPIIYVDSRFAEFCGFRPEEFIGQNCRFLQKDEISIEAKLKAEEVVKQRKEACFEVKNFKKDGTPFINKFKMVPHFDPDGKLIFFVGEHIGCYELEPLFQSKYQTKTQTLLF